MKLTDKQRQHLVVLADGKWRSASSGLHLGTLNSLALKKAIEARYRPIGIGILWRITDAGRRALAEQERT